MTAVELSELLRCCRTRPPLRRDCSSRVFCQHATASQDTVCAVLPLQALRAFRLAAAARLLTPRRAPQ
jgi:hypothetical protein